MLSHPYYPDHETLQGDEPREVLAWNRFALRCRDLFAHGTDTSWYEIQDENGAVSVSWSGAVSPEPVGGGLFGRVVHSDDAYAISLLDLTGSADGSWGSPTEPGTCREATITLLVDAPEQWSVEAAVLGDNSGRFHAIGHRERPHREGRAMEIHVPVISGWTVVRASADRSNKRGK